jgi:hypothetical protein
MLRTTGGLTKREEEFLDWLLEPSLFGERVPGLTKKDRTKIAHAIAQLQSVSRPELLRTGLQDLESAKAQWEHDSRTKRTVYKSEIQSRSHDGTGNVEESERLFLATLIARKRGPKPYEFIKDFLAEFADQHRSAKAIEVRVRRFEHQLGPTGPMSCRWIIRTKFSQFLTLRRQKKLRVTRIRYQTGKMNFRRYCDECNALIMPNPRENLWLESLCQYATACKVTPARPLRG